MLSKVAADLVEGVVAVGEALADDLLGTGLGEAPCARPSLRFGWLGGLLGG
ncbi:MAG: hypothetical protein AAFX99_07140 [Myxococcota bacterium]